MYKICKKFSTYGLYTTKNIWFYLYSYTNLYGTNNTYNIKKRIYNT